MLSNKVGGGGVVKFPGKSITEGSMLLILVLRGMGECHFFQKKQAFHNTRVAVKPSLATLL